MEEQVVAYPRVVSERIDENFYEDKVTSSRHDLHGEAVEIKARGEWQLGGFNFPVSLHITVPPGCPITPAMGDCFKVVVSRDDRGPTGS